MENARSKQSRKHGGDLRRVEQDFAAAAAIENPLEDLLALDDALTRFEQLWPFRRE